MAHTEDHAARHTDGSDDIQEATNLQKGLATSTHITKLEGIAEGADVTGDNDPKAHAAAHLASGSDTLYDTSVIDTSFTLAQSDDGTTFILVSGGDDPVVCTLPSSATAGTRYTFIGHDVAGSIRVPDGRTLWAPWGVIAPSGGTDDFVMVDERGEVHCAVTLEARTSTSWNIVAATGKWELGSNPTSYYWSFDGQGYGNADEVAIFSSTYKLLVGAGFNASAVCLMPFYESMFLPIDDSLDLSGETPPAVAELFTGTPGMVRVRKFDSSTLEATHFAFRVPDDMTAGSDFSVKILGIITESTAPTSGQGVTFQLASFGVGVTESLAGSYGSDTTVYIEDLYTYGCDAQNKVFEITASLSSPWTAGDIAQLRLQRYPAHTYDDYPYDVGVIGLQLTWSRTPAKV